jgi:hypothetical protein
VSSKIPLRDLPLHASKRATSVIKGVKTTSHSTGAAK